MYNNNRVQKTHLTFGSFPALPKVVSSTDCYNGTYKEEVCSMLVHLMLELYGCDRALLRNETLVRRALDEYPARVGMEKVSPVHLYEIETSNPLDAGLSGFVVIAQSHISLL